MCFESGLPYVCFLYFVPRERLWAGFGECCLAVAVPVGLRLPGGIWSPGGGRAGGIVLLGWEFVGADGSERSLDCVAAGGILSLNPGSVLVSALPNFGFQVLPAGRRGLPGWERSLRTDP